jgi:transcriptional regulator with XRE-family HTH domain
MSGVARLLRQQGNSAADAGQEWGWMMESGESAAAEAFGVTLKQLRTEANLSLRELGRRALYDYTRLSRAERGEALIPEKDVATIDGILGAGGTLIALRAAAGSGAPAKPGQRYSVTEGEGDTITVEVSLPGGGSITLRLSRRQFAQILGAGALSAALPLGVTPEDAERTGRALEQPARVDGQVLAGFRRTLDEYYRMDKMLGPGRLVGPVLAQIEVLDGLRPGVRAPYADPLYQVLSQHAEAAGWLFQDSGNLAAASDWSRRAAEWAQCAGDATMAAYMLARQSNIAVLAQDYLGVVQLAAAARRTSGEVDPKLLALALQQQARGHARLGEGRECFALLDQAADTLSRHPTVSVEAAPIYLHQYDMKTLTEQSASCYQVTGQAERAVSILEDAVGATSPSLVRDRGHLTAKLAVAVTRTAHPDPDRAAGLGMDALSAARQTGSARIISELRALDQRLSARWPAHPGSRALREALAA